MPKFKTHEEALAYSNKRAKEYPSRNDYYASNEYKKMYPTLEKLRAKTMQGLAGKAKSAMKQAGAKEGNCVEYSIANPFGEIFIFEGKIKLDKTGIPFVHLNEAVGGKKKVRWHKGFRKIKCPTEAKSKRK